MTTIVIAGVSVVAAAVLLIGERWILRRLWKRAVRQRFKEVGLESPEEYR